jgi:transposase
VGILRPADREPDLREIPNDPKVLRRLFERLKREGPVAACYDAGVSGYDLYRQITGLGVACQVIAPALTPRRPGQRIKTDERDARTLVRLFRAGELTAIHVPDEAEEAVRDLLRCREAVRRDVLRWRHRVVKLLDRHGRRYLSGKNWTKRHWTWLRGQQFTQPVLQRTLDAALFALEQALAHQAELDKAIEALAEQAPHREPVGWLRCFRGIDTLSAMILLGGDRGLPAVPAPPRAHGLSRARAQRVLVRADGTPRRDHQNRQHPCPAGVRRGRVALPPSPRGLGGLENEAGELEAADTILGCPST